MMQTCLVRGTSLDENVRGRAENVKIKRCVQHPLNRASTTHSWTFGPTIQVNPSAEASSTTETMADEKLKADFEQAAEDARTKLPSSLPGKDKIALYGLYKHATEGACKGDRPGMFSQVARYKYDSWNNQKDKTKEEAMKEYVALVNSLQE